MYAIYVWEELSYAFCNQRPLKSLKIWHCKSIKSLVVFTSSNDKQIYRTDIPFVRQLSRCETEFPNQEQRDSKVRESDRLLNVSALLTYGYWIISWRSSTPFANSRCTRAGCQRMKGCHKCSRQATRPPGDCTFATVTFSRAGNSLEALIWRALALRERSTAGQHK